MNEPFSSSDRTDLSPMKIHHSTKQSFDNDTLSSDNITNVVNSVSSENNVSNSVIHGLNSLRTNNLNSLGNHVLTNSSIHSSPLNGRNPLSGSPINNNSSMSNPSSNSTLDSPVLDNGIFTQSRFSSIFQQNSISSDDVNNNVGLRSPDRQSEGVRLIQNQDQSNLNYSSNQRSSTSPTSNSSDSRENSIFDFQNALDTSVQSNGNNYVSSPTRPLTNMNNSLSPNNLHLLGSPSRDLSFSINKDPNRSPLSQSEVWNEQFTQQPISRISGYNESQSVSPSGVRQLGDHFEIAYGIQNHYFDMHHNSMTYFAHQPQIQNINYQSPYIQQHTSNSYDLSSYSDRMSSQMRYPYNGNATPIGSPHGHNFAQILVPNSNSHTSPLQIPLTSPSIHSPTLSFDNSSPSQKSPGKRTNQISTKISNYTSLKELKDHIYDSAKDQNGCRFLQKKLDDKDPKEIELIFEEVFPHITELMTDPFGNYLCQKLVEHCNDTQKTSIIKSVSNDLVKISMNMHGTRAVQKLIECLTTPKQIKLVIRSLKSHVVALIKDLNGNHVIQKCLQKLVPKDKQFIYDAVAGRCVEVATHKHGCCVLQRCVDSAAPDQKDLLNKEIIHHALSLVQNPFGNYVVQYILDLGDAEVNNQVIRKFLGSINVLSTNKFSSNVIEKCFRISNSVTRQEMINELACLQGLEAVLQDSYGNYVIQTALSVADPQQFEVLSRVLKPQIPLIKNTPFGKKIENRLNKPRTSKGKQQKNIQKEERGTPKNQLNGNSSNRKSNTPRE